jgi:hypothetical protein
MASIYRVELWRLSLARRQTACSKKIIPASETGDDTRGRFFVDLLWNSDVLDLAVDNYDRSVADLKDFVKIAGRHHHDKSLLVNDAAELVDTRVPGTSVHAAEGIIKDQQIHGTIDCLIQDPRDPLAF